ncbi:hypothetical protein GCM10023085_27270 [Actinomadura viridis]
MDPRGTGPAGHGRRRFRFLTARPSWRGRRHAYRERDSPQLNACRTAPFPDEANRLPEKGPG